MPTHGELYCVSLPGDPERSFTCNTCIKNPYSIQGGSAWALCLKAFWPNLGTQHHGNGQHLCTRYSLHFFLKIHTSNLGPASFCFNWFCTSYLHFKYTYTLTTEEILQVIDFELYTNAYKARYNDCRNFNGNMICTVLLPPRIQPEVEALHGVGWKTGSLIPLFQWPVTP